MNSIVENANYVLVQGDGHRPNDALVIIDMETMTGVSCLTGRPLWSPGVFGWDGRNMCDVWYDVEGDRRHLGDRKPVTQQE